VQDSVHGGGFALMAWVARQRRTVFAVCGALIAAVLGAAVQEMLDTRLRFAAAAVFAVCILVVTLLAALAALVDSRIQADRDVVVAVEEQMAQHQVLTGVAAGRISALGREVSALAGCIGMKVDTMLLSELNRTKTLESDRTMQLILDAKEEVRILDLLLHDGRWPDEAMDQLYLKETFDAFGELLNRADPPISYRRIVQVSEPHRSLQNALTPLFVRHCHDMIELRRSKASLVSLRVTRTRFPFKFILIDQSAVILQLQEYGDDKEDDLQIWGEVLISDPGGQLVAVFRAIWDELVDDPSTRTVTLADLPPLAAAPAE
jgi:hypothetical protein